MTEEDPWDMSKRNPKQDIIDAFELNKGSRIELEKWGKDWIRKNLLGEK
jgi:hypothetical protein